MDATRRIAGVDEVPAGGTLLFTVRDREANEEREAVLLRVDGEVVGWLNYCQHWTDVRLDKGSGALVRDDEVVCRKHGATFRVDTGYCDFGPCEGATLDGIAVAVEDGGVYLADERYAFEHLGESDDEGRPAGTSGGRIDFTGT